MQWAVTCLALASCKDIKTQKSAAIGFMAMMGGEDIGI